MTSNDEKRHNRGVETLVSRLLKKNYDVVLMNPTYHVGKKYGELDVVAIRDNCFHYYEIKCRDSHTAYNKALKQLHRVKEAFPDLNVQGIYCPLNGGIERIR